MTRVACMGRASLYFKSLRSLSLSLFFFFFFDVDHFKVFIEFVIILLLFYVLVFDLEACGV